MTTETQRDLRNVVRVTASDGEIESLIADLGLDVQWIASDIRGGYIDKVRLTAALDLLYDHAAKIAALVERGENHGN